MSVAGRKKSLVQGTPHIDIPTASNTLLNKSASQSTSLYQQCTLLRARLMRIHDFPAYLSLASKANARQSTDPVHQLWDCLALGTPLCFLYNLLPPPATPITDISTHPDEIDLDPDNIKDKKRATAFFVMGLSKLKQLGMWDDSIEPFTVTDLLDKNRNTNGFVKVVSAVTHLVDRLPPDAFVEDPIPPSPPSGLALPGQDAHFFQPSPIATEPPNPLPRDAAETERKNIIRELLETERKYVQDLEVMQNYARALGQNDVVDQDTIHHLFPGLNLLLDFQRKFLIGLEGTAEQPWKDQRWGDHFIRDEDQFDVYEPYCANYSNAAELMLKEESNLMALSHVINPKSELPAFLIKPVQRICKYPLLLESLAKRSSPSDYPHHTELLEGVAAAKRIADKVNEAQRRVENLNTVKLLATRVEDWKGHHLSNFGSLLLDDVFVVTKSEVDREYHVFLFEKIILCCKDSFAAIQNQRDAAARKMSKSNSILKKQTNSATPSLTSMSAASAKKRTTPLLLKGRIFLNNVTHAVSSTKNGQFALQVYWRGDDDSEFFTLRCRTDEQLKQWESALQRLIKETLAKRHASQSSTPTPYSQYHGRTDSGASSTTLPPYPGPPRHRYEESPPEPVPQRPKPQQQSSMNMYLRDFAFGPGGGGGASRDSPNPPGSSHSNSSYDGGFDPDDDWDETATNSSYAPYPPTSVPSSGRGTPVRRPGQAQSMFPERDIAPGYDRMRAKTEDVNGPVMTQWRGQPAPLRPVAPARSLASAGPEASYGPSVGAGGARLRSQFSSTRLRGAYEDAVSPGAMRSPALPISPAQGFPPTPLYISQQQQQQQQQQRARNRSHSNPTAFSPQSTTPPPPLPISAAQWTNGHQGSRQHGHGITGTMPSAGGYGHGRSRKRESGSSNSTGDSSDYSPQHSQTVSPITPFGSNDSSLAMMSSTERANSLRGARSQMFQNSAHANAVANTAALNFNSPPVKVKVHYGEDLFLLMVPRQTEYHDLVEKVGRKIRLCGGRRDDTPVKIKYRDEDGDMVSLTTDDELQMAFESQQVILHVT